MHTLLKQLPKAKMWSHGLDFGRFDPDYTINHFLWTLFEHYQINCVLDVGAHYGEYGQELRQKGFQGHIFSFEPIQENFVKLAEVAQDDPKWHIFDFALGAQSTTIDINVSKATNFSSFHAPSEYGKQNFSSMHVKTVESVQIKSLAEIFPSLLAQVSSPNIYLKLDTQGWDLEVLAGARDCLQDVVALQSELSLQPIYENMPDWRTALDRFQDSGFVPSAFFTVVRDEMLRLCEIDCVFVRDTRA